MCDIPSAVNRTVSWYGFQIFAPFFTIPVAQIVVVVVVNFLPYTSLSGISLHFSYS
jgi:hypothetical protein